MWRPHLRSLRFRLALLLAAAVMMTAVAAVAITAVIGLTNDHVEGLSSAQRRIELLSALSGRIGDYALTAMQLAGQPHGADGSLADARERVGQAFTRLDAEIADAIGRISDPAERAILSGRSRAVAQMHAHFDLLDRQVTTALAAGPDASDMRISLRLALDAFAANFGPLLSQILEQERALAQTEQGAIAKLSDRLRIGAVALVATTLLLAVLLYNRIAAPLVRRISEVARGAEAVASGRFDTRLAISGRDELGLAMARFNRMAARLARREAALMADQQRLQQTVEERTAELREANRRLADIDQARRRFFTDVSHELRTPLTVILGEAEIGLRTRPRLDDLRGALRTILARARRLHRRVEDLLRIARSETGQIELELAPVEVGDLLREVHEDVDSIARAAGITIVLPETTAAPIMIEADREWLRQVIEGVLANAVRHAPAGSEVVLSACLDEDTAVITVADTGPGIREEDLPHVFERFYRGGGEAEGQGFGIGLALAKWVVERHGGSIGIETSTDPGSSGTRVSICLPRQAQFVSEAAQ